MTPIVNPALTYFFQKKDKESDNKLWAQQKF